MRLLLDTHVFLWSIWRHTWLPSGFAEAIADRRNDVYVSAATVWEIAIKRKLGRLAFAGSVRLVIYEMSYRELPIGAAHAEAAGDLPLLHRDPFDRLLVAQAHSERLTLLTIDTEILRYEPPTL